MNNFSSLKKKANLLEAKKELLSQQLVEKQERRNSYAKRLEASQKARIFFQEIATLTQQKVEKRISSIVSMALEAVFPEPYKFVLEFIPKRNQTECLLLFEKNEERIKPIDASGGGTIDVASIALRIAFLTLNKKARRIMLLDEPLRFVSKNYIDRCGELLQLLSERNKIQFIIVTHLDELIDYGDKVFEL